MQFTALELMHESLDVLEVPQEGHVSPEQFQQFEFRLKSAFLEALSSMDRAELDTLRMSNNAIFFDETSSRMSKFTRGLSLAQSEKIRNLPEALFKNYLRKTSELNLNNVWQNPSQLLERSVLFVISNLQPYPESPQTDAEPISIDRHNKHVFKYWLLCLNSGVVNNLSYGVFFEHRRSTSIVYNLYAICFAIINFVLVVALLVMVSAAVLTFLLSRLVEHILSSLILMLRNRIERPLLNRITAGHYDEHVEKMASMILGKEYREEDNEFVWIDSDADSEDQVFTIEEMSALGKRVLQAKVNQKLATTDGTQSSSDTLRQKISRKVADDIGINHFRYVTQSIYASLTQSIPAGQSKLCVIPLRLLCLVAGMVVVVCLSLPLVLADMVTAALPLLGLGISTLSSLMGAAMLALSNVLQGLPLALYDACWGPQNQIFGLSAAEKAKIMGSVCEGLVENLRFFSGSAFGRDRMKEVAQIVEERVHIPK